MTSATEKSGNPAARRAGAVAALAFAAVLDQKDASAIRTYIIKRANEDKAASGK